MRSGAMCVAILALLCATRLPAQRAGRMGAAPANVIGPPVKGVTLSFHGTVKEVKKKLILLQTDDNRLMTFRRTSKTKFVDGDHNIKGNEVDLDSTATVDVVEDIDLKFLALTVTLDASQKKPRGLITR
jgi:hypothetical protein